MLKYAGLERLGVRHEGPDVVLEIMGKQARMPWHVAALLQQNLGKHILAARQNDPAFCAAINEVKNG